MSAAAAVVYMQPVIGFSPVWFKATLHIGMPLLVATGKSHEGSAQAHTGLFAQLYAN